MKTDKRDFYKTLLMIAVPVAMQNLITASLNMVDTVMIGKLGENALEAVGIANQLFFLFNLVCFGICSGGSIFIAQYWGRKDILHIRSAMGFILSAVVLCSSFFSLIAVFFPKIVMLAFRADEEVTRLGIDYLRIVGFSYIVTACTFAYSFSSRSVQKAAMPMLISAAALLINAILNYILIFGKLGFEPMGVRGAAIGTLVARFVEFCLMSFMIYASRSPLAGTFSELMSFDRAFIRRYKNTALPVVLNEIAWSAGIVMYSVAYSRIGKSAIAAVQVSNVVSNLFMVFSFGLANACGVMLGNKLGEGDREEAIAYSGKFLHLTFVTGALIGMMIYLSTPLILSVFSVNENLTESVRKMLTIKAAFLPLMTFNAALIVGILRSGGDTKYAMFLEMGSVWGIGVPMAFLGAVALKLPIHFVMLMISSEEIFKTVVGVPRVLSKKWVKTLV